MFFARNATIVASVAVFGFFLSAAGARSDDRGPSLQLANKPDFTEHFAGNAQVSGQFLSGLAFATETKVIDLKEMRVFFTRKQDQATGQLCVKVTSEDGRYWASNMYNASSTFDTPPSVPLDTKYEAQLQHYQPAGLLLLASFSESCDETAGKTYVPGLFGARAPGDDLVAYVNISQSKVTAKLVDSAEVILLDVNCKRPSGGAKVAFSHLCRLPAAKLGSGDHKLVIKVRGLTGHETEQGYAVHLE